MRVLARSTSAMRVNQPRETRLITIRTRRNGCETKFMQKTYIAWTQSKTIRVLPVRMPFTRLLDELELAESETRSPRLRLAGGFRLSKQEFGQFCRRNLLHLAGQWNGLSVYVRPDFIWPG